MDNLFIQEEYDFSFGEILLSESCYFAEGSPK